jgi:hypothetical protein
MAFHSPPFPCRQPIELTPALNRNLLTGRKNIIYGPFKLGRVLGFTFSGVACGYMVVWFVIYCFPFALPTSKSIPFPCYPAFPLPFHLSSHQPP